MINYKCELQRHNTRLKLIFIHLTIKFTFIAFIRKIKNKHIM